MMAHIPEDENFDEYMNASADEWSKPEEAGPPPDEKEERVNRWGSPVADEATVNDGDRWGAPEMESDLGPNAADFMPTGKKPKTRGWIIAVVVVVALCLCVCLVLAGLTATGALALPLGL
jgi:hypothetical protein